MKRASLADAERLRGPVDAGECHVSRDTSPAAAPGGRTLWLWVAAGFLFLGLLWSAMFLVARAARIESVALPPKEARP